LAIVSDIRLIADYSDEEVSADRAGWAIDQAKEFVKAMRAHCTT
jgi:hypothetical protein